MADRLLTLIWVLISAQGYGCSPNHSTRMGNVHAFHYHGVGFAAHAWGKGRFDSSHLVLAKMRIGYLWRIILTLFRSQSKYKKRWAISR